MDFTNKRLIYFFFFLLFVSPVSAQSVVRESWVDMMDKIARPVISSLAEDNLKKVMPIETKIDRAYNVAYLEAFGRTLCGIAPWLELGPDSTSEGMLRAEYINMVIKCIDNATNPKSKDYMNFTEFQQPLVDAAFLAHGLLRSKNQIWNRLDDRIKKQVIDCFKSTRIIRVPTNNWLLFSGMIEAFLLENGLDADLMRMDYAVNKHLERYKGDGVYGDGDYFHWDYYNSFVIQPMLMDICFIMEKHNLISRDVMLNVKKRMSRYAEILEMSISPEGTFPPFGRSICYRMGVFQALGQVVLQHNLSSKLTPSQVRCALDNVYCRLFNNTDIFDDKGWLQIGLYGHQPSLGEDYINTGSLYLCLTGFLPLGLPSTDKFWTMPDEKWTSLKIWNGDDIKADYSI